MAYYTVLTTVGKAWIVDKLDDTVATVGDWVGWGTGAAEAAVGDTVLSSEDSAGSPPYARIQGAKSQPAADTKRVVATIVSNGAKTITNAGLFTADTSGTLIVHGNFAGITLALNDQIQFTIDIQIT
jgi:hypothetical protein